MKRAISATIGIILAVIAIVLGDWWLTIPMLVAAGLASQELFWLFEEKGYRPARYLGIVSCLSIYFLTQISGNRYHAPFLIVVFALSFLVLIFRNAPWAKIWIRIPGSPEPTDGIASISDVATTFLGIIYAGWLPSHVLLIRQLDRGLSFIFLLFFIVFATDIGAYLVGKKWGKHPLIGAISPKKTLEGALGGLFFSVAIALIVGLIFGLTWWKCAVFAAIISPVAQLSDLSESLIKRDAGKKDSGDIIPGHGGMLDRVDSFILTSGVAFYIITLFWSRF